MSAHARNDSIVASPIVSRVHVKSNALKRQHLQGALDISANKAKNRNVVATDIAMNKRLKEHIQNRGLMEAGERTLRIEIFWFERELRFMRAISTTGCERYVRLVKAVEEKRDELARHCAGVEPERED